MLAVRRIRDQYGEPYSTVVFTLYGAAPVRISSSYVSRCVSYSNGSSDHVRNGTNELVIAGDNDKLTFYHQAGVFGDRGQHTAICVSVSSM